MHRMAPPKGRHSIFQFSVPVSATLSALLRWIRQRHPVGDVHCFPLRILVDDPAILAEVARKHICAVKRNVRHRLSARNRQHGVICRRQPILRIDPLIFFPTQRLPIGGSRSHAQSSCAHSRSQSRPMIRFPLSCDVLRESDIVYSFLSSFQFRHIAPALWRARELKSFVAASIDIFAVHGAALAQQVVGTRPPELAQLFRLVVDIQF